MPARPAASMLVLAVLSLAACGGGDDDDVADTASPAGATAAVTAASPGSTTAAPTASAPTSAPVASTDDGDGDDAGVATCGIDEDGVEAALGFDVVQNDTGVPERCNFTWDDGGPRGLDVARVVGRRDEFEASSGVMPADGGQLEDGSPYELLSGIGETAWLFGSANQANVVVLDGDDVLLVGMVTTEPVDGPTTESGVSAELADGATAVARAATS